MATTSGPPKKKRPDDQIVLEPATGQKPVQLQRRRVWRACESCRRKKIKCDGNEPTCTQCATTGSQCTWLQTKDRAALSRHYVQELEARLIQMETLFKQVAPTLQQLGQLPAGIGPDGVLSEGPLLAAPPAIAQVLSLPDQPTTYTSSDPHGLDASQVIKIEDDEDDFAESQLAQDEHGSLRWMGNSSTMSLIHSFRSLTTDPQQRVQHRVSPGEGDARGTGANRLYFPASVFFGKIRALPGPEEVEYPDRDLADKLVNTYFLRFHFLLPIIDKSSFMQKYNIVMDNTTNVSLHRSETAFISLLFAVFACASRMVEDSRLQTKIGEHNEDGGMGMVYYERALVLQYISHAAIHVHHVQSFTLMASFLCSVNCLPQAWLLIGQAVRCAQDLGLHRSPRGLMISALEKEHRRKTWWGVYTMDRMLAVALGRPLGVDDRDCDVELCVHVDEDDLAGYFEGVNVNRDRPALMSGSIALVTLYKIAGRILRQVYSIDVFMEELEPTRKMELQRNVELLDKELSKWSDDLPTVFKSQAMNEQDVSMGAVLCSHYYSIVSTLHRNFLPINKEHIPSPTSTAKAFSSARACIVLAPSIKNVVPPSHHLAFFIQNLFSSAVIMLLYAMHVANPQAAGQAFEAASNSIVALEAWEGQWPGARKCRELLNELAHTAAEAMKVGPRPIAATTSVGGAPGRVGAPGLSLSTSVAPAAGPSSPRSPTARFDPTRGGAVRRPRRDRSHDPYTHGRQNSRSGSFREALAQRARSTSRVRYDDAEMPDRSSTYSSMMPYPAAPAAAAAAIAGVSAHSSPAASVNSAGSPREPTMDLSGATHSSPKIGSPAFTIAQVHVPSPPRPFNYPFTTSRQQQAVPQMGQQQMVTPVSAVTPEWHTAAPAADPARNMLYTPGQDPNLFISGQAHNNGFYYSFDDASALGVDPSVIGATPNPTFAAPGLPFTGLDFIRNYTPDGLTNTLDDSLWQAIDPRAFQFESEVPWSLADLPPIDENHH